MLVLTRKSKEGKKAIIFFLPDGRPVNVTVEDVKHDAVRIGIEAPDDVKILRGELVQPPKHQPLAQPALTDSAVA